VTALLELLETAWDLLEGSFQSLWARELLFHFTSCSDL